MQFDCVSLKWTHPGREGLTNVNFEILCLFVWRDVVLELVLANSRIPSLDPSILGYWILFDECISWRWPAWLSSLKVGLGGITSEYLCTTSALSKHIVAIACRGHSQSAYSRDPNKRTAYVYWFLAFFPPVRSYLGPYVYYFMRIGSKVQKTFIKFYS